MEKWIMVVRTNCSDPSREGEFNEWYDKSHLPDVMQVPGYVRATRFVNPDFSSYESGKFLTIFEIETEDINQTLVTMEEHRAELRKQGRSSELPVIVSRALYKQISSMDK